MEFIEINFSSAGVRFVQGKELEELINTLKNIQY